MTFLVNTILECYEIKCTHLLFNVAANLLGGDKHDYYIILHL